MKTFLGLIVAAVLLTPIATIAGDYSKFDFTYRYNDGSGDYYTGYVYAPTAFETYGAIVVGTKLEYEPEGLGSKALSGYYEITAITDGFDSSYDKKEYITSYYDGNIYKASEGVNTDASTTAGVVYVADRSGTDESGYVVTQSQINTSTPYETKTGHVTSDNNFAWDYSYDIGFFADFTPYKSADRPKLEVDIDIQLTGDDPGTTIKNTWETGIEGTWNNKYQIQYGSEKYSIEFNVDWVTASADQIVTVHNATDTSPYQTNMTNWYTDQPGGWPNSYAGTVMAHEFGHMLGLYDEYSGGATDPATHFTTTNALMADLGPVQQRYYNNFLSWLKTKSGKDSLSLVTYSASAPASPEGGDPYATAYSDPRDDALTPYIEAAAPATVGSSAFGSQAVWTAYWSQTPNLMEEDK